VHPGRLAAREFYAAISCLIVALRAAERAAVKAPEARAAKQAAGEGEAAPLSLVRPERRVRTRSVATRQAQAVRGMESSLDRGDGPALFPEVA
jgi:hypothetical protein